MNDKINICTEENPMPKGSAGRWQHSNVIEVGECLDGCCAYYKCLNCNHEWKQELPQ